MDSRDHPVCSAGKGSASWQCRGACHGSIDDRIRNGDRVFGDVNQKIFSSIPHSCFPSYILIRWLLADKCSIILYVDELKGPAGNGS